MGSAQTKNQQGRSAPRRKIAAVFLAAALGLVLSGCTAIRESRGYIVDPLLLSTVAPGIDNQTSVEATLGRPTFTSQYGAPTWYYVASITGQRPFNRARIREHSVTAVRFDAAGKVIAVDNSGIEKVAFLDPQGDKTPTLGRERTFLEDLFGNIGQVGGLGGQAGVPGGPGPNGQ